MYGQRGFLVGVLATLVTLINFSALAYVISTNNSIRPAQENVNIGPRTEDIELSSIEFARLHPVLHRSEGVLEPDPQLLYRRTQSRTGKNRPRPQPKLAGGRSGSRETNRGSRHSRPASPAGSSQATGDQQTPGAGPSKTKTDRERSKVHGGSSSRGGNSNSRSSSRTSFVASSSTQDGKRTQRRPPGRNKGKINAPTRSSARLAASKQNNSQNILANSNRLASYRTRPQAPPARSQRSSSSQSSSQSVSKKGKSAPRIHVAKSHNSVRFPLRRSARTKARGKTQKQSDETESRGRTRTRFRNLPKVQAHSPGRSPNRAGEPIASDHPHNQHGLKNAQRTKAGVQGWDPDRPRRFVTVLDGDPHLSGPDAIQVKAAIEAGRESVWKAGYTISQSDKRMLKNRLARLPSATGALETSNAQRVEKGKKPMPGGRQANGEFPPRFTGPSTQTTGFTVVPLENSNNSGAGERAAAQALTGRYRGQSVDEVEIRYQNVKPSQRGNEIVDRLTEAFRNNDESVIVPGEHYGDSGETYSDRERSKDAKEDADQPLTPRSADLELWLTHLLARSSLAPNARDF